tara:strand:- start:28560 stop:29270 length:711 start_codon:yes stop_codon:yes gene_type:complete
MTIDPDKWIKTLPNNNLNDKSNENNADYEKWISTIPKKNNIKFKKYYLSLTIIIIGLVSVSAIKNKTRNLQKEISNLHASIDILKKDLHKSTLEHEFITSPENIMLLAKEYLELELTTYKAEQIKHLENKNLELIISEPVKKDEKKKLSESIKSQVAKKIKKKKNELAKLKKLYKNPETIPGEVKAEVAKKIEAKKIELKELYNSPKETITVDKFQKWGVIQLVKVFLGIPVVPGK